MSLALWSCSKEENASPNSSSPNRYQEKIFDSVSVQTVEYSSVYGLSMDIYSPFGDDLTNRPVIVFAHGGAFVAGSRDIGEMKYWCKEFAKRGYVTASISYRLAASTFDLLDTLSALDVVTKAISDGHAAIRYFRMSASQGNPHGVDPNRIIAGGTSAGAVLMLHVAYMNDTIPLGPHLREIVRNNGGISGNSGNPGFSSEVMGVLNLSGGLHRLQWMENGEAPVYSVHGDQDGTVPFDCGSVFQGALPNANLVTLCGSDAIHDHALNVGVSSQLKVLVGQDHCPWIIDSGVNAIGLEMEQEMAVFCHELL